VAAEIVIEEEVHLLDAGHLAAVSRAAELLELVRPGPGLIAPGRTDGQIRLVTAPASGADASGAALAELRARAADAARAVDVRLAACGIAPLRNWPGPLDGVRQVAALTVRLPGAPVTAAERLRPWLPALLAVAASSPWSDGIDSGRASSRWPDIRAGEDAGLVVAVCDAVPRIVEAVTLTRLIAALAAGPQLPLPDTDRLDAGLELAAMGTGQLDDPSSPTSSRVPAAQVFAALVAAAGQTDAPLLPPAARLRAAGSAAAAARLVVTETTEGLPHGEVIRRPAGPSLSADERRLLAERPPHHG
jgi:hypothetical protein